MTNLENYDQRRALEASLVVRQKVWSKYLSIADSLEVKAANYRSVAESIQGGIVRTKNALQRLEKENAEKQG